MLLCLLIGCQKKKKENIELEILTKEINASKVKSTEYREILNSNIHDKNAKTILVYKLTNNNDKAYYFNLDPFNKSISLNSIKMDRVFMSIFNNKGQKITIDCSSSLIGTSDSLDIVKFELMDYNIRYFKHRNSKNFVIHPYETLYFEWFIVLPYGTMLEDNNYEVELDSQKKYFANISMYSDGMYYKKTLSRTDLATIKKNGYEVFNGVITSKNKVPIRFKSKS